MDFLIRENQLKLILTESDKSSFGQSLKKMNVFTQNLVNKVKRKFGLNLKLLATWGTSVGGLVLPLDNFIKTGNFQLDENQVALILLGVISIIYFDNKNLIKKILPKIKDEGIEKEFEYVLEKGLHLRKAFVQFLLSLDVSLKSITELLSYSFLIPIILDIQNVVRGDENLETSIEFIFERMLDSGLVLLAYEGLHEVLKKISNRLK